MITIHTNPTINRPQLARLFADGFIDDPVWTAIRHSLGAYPSRVANSSK